MLRGLLRPLEQRESFSALHVHLWSEKTTVCRIFNCQRANLVENTGLEPVTSWLQTRRSPS